ncbi:MAG: hypothetical protein JO129_00860 [Candidatus Dependentiae bacterium]|nr:hypothetical protein [Candidatus Dependentiae bacterium]
MKKIYTSILCFLFVATNYSYSSTGNQPIQNKNKSTWQYPVINGIRSIFSSKSNSKTDISTAKNLTKELAFNATDEDWVNITKDNGIESSTPLPKNNSNSSLSVDPKFSNNPQTIAKVLTENPLNTIDTTASTSTSPIRTASPQRSASPQLCNNSQQQIATVIFQEIKKIKEEPQPTLIPQKRSSLVLTINPVMQHRRSPSNLTNNDEPQPETTPNPMEIDRSLQESPQSPEEKTISSLMCCQCLSYFDKKSEIKKKNGR